MKKDKYINPFTDFGFKKIFGSEFNKDILMDFLNELLKGQEHITDLQYKQNEHHSRSPEDRMAVFDLYCEIRMVKSLSLRYSVVVNNFLKIVVFFTLLSLFRNKLLKTKIGILSFKKCILLQYWTLNLNHP